MTVAFDRVGSPKLADLISATLRREIVEGLLAGRLHAGDAFPSEKDLIARFGAARPTLREAMRILASHWLIGVQAGAKGGAYVCVPDSQLPSSHFALLLQLRGATMEQVWMIRVQLEPIGVGLVAAKPTVEGVADLRAAVEEPRESVRDLRDARIPARSRWRPACRR